MPNRSAAVRPRPAREDQRARRQQLPADEVSGLRDLFKVLASETRLRLLHMLVQEEELCVSELAMAVAMTPQAVSNQLQRLLDRGVVTSRRVGSNVYYRIEDPCMPILLARGLCLLEEGKRRA